MRDEIKGSVKYNECFVMNIDHSSNEGTHWTCLFAKNGVCYYFDSYGFPPTEEIKQYCEGHESYYNTDKIQNDNEVICGHYCIYTLYLLDKGIKFNDILNKYFINYK